MYVFKNWKYFTSVLIITLELWIYIYVRALSTSSNMVENFAFYTEVKYFQFLKMYALLDFDKTKENVKYFM